MHPLDRKFQICAVLCLAFALAFAIALRGLITQKRTIADLRAEMNRAAPVASSESPQASEVVEREPVGISDPPKSAASIPAAIAAPGQEPTATNAELPVLRAENDRLGAQLRDVEAELAQTKRLIPEPEVPKEAYVGPGTWVNADGQARGITRTVISGEALRQSHFSTMTIKLWGRCVPLDCELKEVPFFLLDWIEEASRSYRRGFAAWEFESGARKYLIVTFEKSGLKVEDINIPGERGVSPQRRVEKMTRIQ